MFNNINLTSLAQIFIAQNEPDKIWNNPLPEPLVTPQGDKPSWVDKYLDDYDRQVIKSFFKQIGVAAAGYVIPGIIAYTYMKQKTKGLNISGIEDITRQKLTEKIKVMCQNPDKVPTSIGKFLSLTKRTAFDPLYPFADINGIGFKAGTTFLLGGTGLLTGLAMVTGYFSEDSTTTEEHNVALELGSGLGSGLGIMLSMFLLFKASDLLDPLINSSSAITQRYAGSRKALTAVLGTFRNCNPESIKKLEKLLRDLEAKEQKRNAGMKQRIDTSDTLVPPKGYKASTPDSTDANRLMPGGKSLRVTPLAPTPKLKTGTLLRAVPAEVILPKVI